MHFSGISQGYLLGFIKKAPPHTTMQILWQPADPASWACSKPLLLALGTRESTGSDFTTVTHFCSSEKTTISITPDLTASMVDVLNRSRASRTWVSVAVVCT